LADERVVSCCEAGDFEPTVGELDQELMPSAAPQALAD